MFDVDGFSGIPLEKHLFQNNLKQNYYLLFEEKIKMMTTYGFIIFCAFLALVYGIYAGRFVMRAPVGTAKCKIAAAIQEGAMAF